MKRSLNLLALTWCVLLVRALGASTNVAPADAFALRRWEWLPQLPNPRFQAATFPRETPVVAVEDMVFSEGRLWLTARPAREPELPAGSGRLWSFSPALNRLEPVKGVLTNHFVNALLAADRRLWLAVNGGLATLDFGDFSVEGFNVDRGLLATNVVGLARIDGLITALGSLGGVYALPAGGKDFVRGNVPLPSPNPRLPPPWRFYSASGSWALAATETNVFTRNLQANQWLPLRDELNTGSPRLTPSRLQCVVGDGNGNFWIGSDAGLHWLDPEAGQVENRFASPGVLVPGGLGVTVAPGYQVTPAAYRQAHERVLNGVRDRMRDRARRARTQQEGRGVASPVTPTSRLPGGVTALLADHGYLWVATTDGSNPHRGRVLLYHPASRRWVGWVPVGAPVRSLAANDRNLWIGLAVANSPGVSPLVVLDKLPLLAVPPVRWTRDSLAPEELGPRLAALPLKERAVYAFFAGDAAKVVELLAPDGQPAPGADAETLFLLAFAHDPLGLNQPDKLDQWLARLQQQDPKSLFAELATQVRPVKPVEPLPTAAAPAEPVPQVEAETVDSVLDRRDLNRDGKLNAVELRLWRGPDAKLSTADQNGDGQLDRAELEALLKR